MKELANLLIGSTVCGEQYLHVIIFNLMSQKLFSDHLRLGVCTLNIAYVLSLKCIFICVKILHMHDDDTYKVGCIMLIKI